MIFRSDGTWQVRVGRRWYQVRALDGDPDCIPVVVEIDGRKVADGDELADLIAGKTTTTLALGGENSRSAAVTKNQAPVTGRGSM